MSGEGPELAPVALVRFLWVCLTGILVPLQGSDFGGGSYVWQAMGHKVGAKSRLHPEELGYRRRVEKVEDGGVVWSVTQYPGRWWDLRRCQKVADRCG